MSTTRWFHQQPLFQRLLNMPSWVKDVDGGNRKHNLPGDEIARLGRIPLRLGNQLMVSGNPAIFLTPRSRGVPAKHRCEGLTKDPSGWTGFGVQPE
jgi:hypothetical protein